MILNPWRKIKFLEDCIKDDMEHLRAQSEEINALKEKLSMHGALARGDYYEIADLNEALLDIIAEERPTSNATVRRMARIARTALGK